MPFTLGKVDPRAYNPADEIQRGQQLQIVGSDLQFIEKAIIPAEDGGEVEIYAIDFYRKTESFIKFNIPKTTSEGETVIKLIAVDGNTYSVPTLINITKPQGTWETREIDLAGDIVYQSNQSKNLEYPFIPQWGGDGQIRFLTDGEHNLQTLGITTDAKINFYKDASSTGQLQLNTPSWQNNIWNPSFDSADWNGDKTLIEIPFTQQLLDLLAGNGADGNCWLIVQGDGLQIDKITLTYQVYVEPTDDGGSGGDDGEIDLAGDIVYQNDFGKNLEYPFYPQWGGDGQIRFVTDGAHNLQSMGLTTDSKIIFYKETGSTGQLQLNTPSWVNNSWDPPFDATDWNGDKDKIEVQFTPQLLDLLAGNGADGNCWLIVQGDGLTITKIVLIP